MADRRALKFVGIVYGGVAAIVTVTAFLVVLHNVQAGVADVVYGVATPRPAIASVR